MRSVALRAALAAAIAGPGAVAVAVPDEAEAAPGCDVDVAPEAENMIIDKTDDLRRAHGVPAVRRDNAIKSAARRWSVRMAKTGAFVHSRLGWARGRAGGENIAMAPTPKGAFQAMLDSPPHRRNLLKRAWRYRGIGVASRCDGALLVTVNLMAPGRRR